MDRRARNILAVIEPFAKLGIALANLLPTYPQ